MPQVIFKGISNDDVKRLANNLSISMAAAIDCPKEWISIEVNPTEYFNNHSKEGVFPVVNVHWFARSKDVQDKVAELIKEHVFECGYKRVQVYFYKVDKAEYYDFK